MLITPHCHQIFHLKAWWMTDKYLEFHNPVFTVIILFLLAQLY